MSACWRYLGAVGDYRTDSLTEIWNNEKMRNLRKAHLNGEEPHECRACWDFEHKGLKSPRLTSNANAERIGLNEAAVLQDMADDYSMPIEKLTKIEMRFDNICNLMCRHCSPVYSSQWHSAVNRDADFYEEIKQHIPVRKEEKHVRLTDQIIAEAQQLSEHVNWFMVGGGEPLVHPKHYQFLENILPNAHKIHLDYNSNLHTLEFKGKDILDLWKQFKSFQIRVSMDGYPPIYEYKRVNSDIDAVERNIARLINELPKANIQVTCTTSILNITRITEIFEYYNSIGGSLHTSLVQEPHALNPKSLPPSLKQEVTERWNAWIINVEENLMKTGHKHIIGDNRRFENQVRHAHEYGNYVIDYMNSEDKYEEWWSKTQHYITALDRYHKTDVLDYYPEFKPYWN